MNRSWQNVVGNLYQSILGTHEFKVEVITEWLSDIRDAQLDINIKEIVEQCSERYNR